MDFVYICSAYRGNIKNNTKLAREYCKRAINNGFVPIAPHLYFPQFMNDNNSKERELAIKICLDLIDSCSEVWVFGHKISPGMKKEIIYAKLKDKKIRHFE